MSGESKSGCRHGKKDPFNRENFKPSTSNARRLLFCDRVGAGRGRRSLRELDKWALMSSATLNHERGHICHFCAFPGWAASRVLGPVGSRAVAKVVLFVLGSAEL
jgi:hypothetical protein